MATANFHKAQAEEMIKKLNGMALNIPHTIQKDFIVTLAHALLANVKDET